MQDCSASIFYQAENYDIVNALFQCDLETGTFKSQGSWIISADAPSVSNDTGLAAVLLGASAGYRVYFHDDHMAVHQISYTTKTNWLYSGAVSQGQLPSRALHAASSMGARNISVVRPRDDGNIEVSRLCADKSWHIGEFWPTPPIPSPPMPGRDLTSQQPSIANKSIQQPSRAR
jgi:hypothetical protein